METVTTESVTTDVVSRRRSPRRWFVIGGIALVLVLIVGYVLAGAALAAGPVARADRALKTTLTHNNSIADVFSNEPFKNIDFSADNPDLTAAKNALAKVRHDLAGWQADVTNDRAALLRAQADLQSSFLTLPEQSVINSHRHRVDAAISAMTTAQKGIDIFSKQLAFVDPFIDVIGGFIAIGNAAGSNDLNALQAQLTTTSASLQKAIKLAQSASLPTEILKGLQTMQQAVADMQALVSAVKSGDVAAVQKYAAAVEADGKALEATDQKAIEKAERALFQQLGDSYDRDMKTAAG